MTIWVRWHSQCSLSYLVPDSQVGTLNPQGILRSKLRYRVWLLILECRLALSCTWYRSVMHPPLHNYLVGTRFCSHLWVRCKDDAIPQDCACRPRCLFLCLVNTFHKSNKHKYWGWWVWWSKPFQNRNPTHASWSTRDTGNLSLLSWPYLPHR